MSRYSLFFASLCTFSLLFLLSCKPDEPRFVTIGGPPNDPEPLESYRCVEVDDSRNPKLSVLQALQERPELSQFAELIPEMQQYR